MDWNYQQSIKSACIILKNFLSSLRASVRLDFEYWLQVAVRLVQIVMKTRFSARLNHLTSFFSLRAIETNSSNSRKRQRRERIEREEMSLVGNIYLLPQKKKERDWNDFSFFQIESCDASKSIFMITLIASSSSAWNNSIMLLLRSFPVFFESTASHTRAAHSPKILVNRRRRLHSLENSKTSKKEMKMNSKLFYCAQESRSCR